MVKAPAIGQRSLRTVRVQMSAIADDQQSLHRASTVRNQRPLPL
jgi:hypothetical protein